MSDLANIVMQNGNQAAREELWDLQQSALDLQNMRASLRNIGVFEIEVCNSCGRETPCPFKCNAPTHRRLENNTEYRLMESMRDLQRRIKEALRSRDAALKEVASLREHIGTHIMLQEGPRPHG
jgi:hypothetical protein